ncbi:MAG: site-specific DNA-methyltransferase [Acidobacteriota bacterium]|nr:site-specific DNA-methyltransferase [Acidobacteriota bacterium]
MSDTAHDKSEPPDKCPRVEAVGESEKAQHAQSMGDGELCEFITNAWSPAKKILRDNLAYIAEARKRFAQPGRRVPVAGKPTWGNWIEQNLGISDRHVRRLLAGKTAPQKRQEKKTESRVEVESAGITLGSKGQEMARRLPEGDLEAGKKIGAAKPDAHIDCPDSPLAAPEHVKTLGNGDIETLANFWRQVFDPLNHAQRRDLLVRFFGQIPVEHIADIRAAIECSPVHADSAGAAGEAEEMSGLTAVGTQEQCSQASNDSGSATAGQDLAALGQSSENRIGSEFLIVRANARNIPLADNSVQCVVTSPPYFGLRKYAGEQELVWPVSQNRGVVRCNRGDHSWGETIVVKTSDTYNVGFNERCGNASGKRKQEASSYGQVLKGCFCQRCGAWRGAFGLEPTIAMYVQHSVEILREIRRVLRPDGVCFWNIGDSYANTSSRAGGQDKQSDQQTVEMRGITKPIPDGLKPKDLCLIPQRIALAAQQDGWCVRDVIIWQKPNPMPESVGDRCTRSYEPILMLTKSEQYYWNKEAIKEPSKYPNDTRKSRSRSGQKRLPTEEVAGIRPGSKTYPFRNPRNVWTFPTQPYSGAHFATFPEQLPRRCILAGSRPGDVVLDPFGGSGTTAKVAAALARRAVSIDLAYHDIARERVAAGCRQTNAREETSAEPLSVTVNQREAAGGTLQGADVPMPSIPESVPAFGEESQGMGIPLPC